MVRKFVEVLDMSIANLRFVSIKKAIFAKSILPVITTQLSSCVYELVTQATESILMVTGSWFLFWMIFQFEEQGEQEYPFGYCPP